MLLWPVIAGLAWWVGGFVVCGLCVIGYVLVIVLVGSCRVGLVCCCRFGLVCFTDLCVRLMMMCFLRFGF